jgi:hypothetical protein
VTHLLLLDPGIADQKFNCPSALCVCAGSVVYAQ